MLNRFIVPMPSDIIAAFPRVIEEEQVLHRFVLTATEALSATILVTVLGVTGGVLLHRYLLLRQATETWVAAVAAACPSGATSMSNTAGPMAAMAARVGTSFLKPCRG